MRMLLADSFLHHFDPFAFRFSENVGLRWYGLSYAVGFLLAWLFARWMAKSGRSTLTVRDVGDMMFSVILGVLIGGRLGYAILYEQRLLTDFTGQFPFWGLFAINKGGMASHGGMVGVIIALTWFGRRRGLSVLHMLDIGCLASTFGLFLGRIANFINAELWGKPLPDLQQSYVIGRGLTQVDPPWWSIKYPQEVTELWTHANDARLEMLEPLQRIIADADRFYPKIVAAAQKGDAPVVATLKPLLTAYYPSQLIQALTDGPLLAAVLVLVWLKPRKPGVVGSWFLIAYAVMRVITEMFRQPDEGVALTFGLSRGQLLSALMFLTGCVCLWIATHRKVEKMSGLLRPMHARE